MTLQNRFHFLNLWDETPSQGEGRHDEDKEGSVREQKSACVETSQWPNKHSGMCVFVFLHMWAPKLGVLLTT